MLAKARALLKYILSMGEKKTEKPIKPRKPEKNNRKN